MNWEDGAWFECREAERFSHDNPTDAIEEYLDDLYEKGKTWRQALEEAAPLHVSSWRRKSEEEWFAEVDGSVESAVVFFEEQLAEENGDPDDGEIPGLTPTVRAELLAAWRVAAARIFKLRDIHSWSCERIGVRVFDADQLEAYMRENAPAWFAEFEDP